MIRLLRKPALAAAILVVLVLLHAPLLRLCTWFVITHETLPRQTDAVLLHERGDNRHAVAAQWVNSGRAQTILLPRKLPDRNVATGVIAPHDEFCRKKLLELKVQGEAIETLVDAEPRGEWRYIRLLESWLRNRPGASAVVLCDQFESRFVRHAIEQVLSRADAQRVHVCGLPSLAYDGRNWWRSRRGSVQMFQSLLAQVYARCAGEDEDDPITWDVDAYEKALGP